MINVNDSDETANSNSSKEYVELSNIIMDLFNPDIVEGETGLEIMVKKLKKISNFIQEIQCTCIYDSIEGHTVCKRCGLLGRFEDEPV